MRAVVIAVKDGRAAVAGKGGTLVYIEDHGYEIGQVLEVSAAPVTSGEGAGPAAQMIPGAGGQTVTAGGKQDITAGRIRRFPGRNGYRSLHLWSAVAAALLVILITGGVTAYAAPVSTVTLDSDASVSYGLNVFDRVVSVSATDAEGEILLEELSGRVRGKHLSEAMEETLTILRDNDYITEEDTPAAATVDSRIGTGDRRKERLLTELRAGADDWNKVQRGISVSFDASEVTEELSERARERGVTPGRILLEDMRREQEKMRDPEQAVSQDAQDRTDPSIRTPQEPQDQQGSQSGMTNEQESQDIPPQDQRPGQQGTSSEGDRSERSMDSGKPTQAPDDSGKNAPSQPDADVPVPGQAGGASVNGEPGNVPPDTPESRNESQEPPAPQDGFSSDQGNRGGQQMPSGDAAGQPAAPPEWSAPQGDPSDMQGQPEPPQDSSMPQQNAPDMPGQMAHPSDRPAGSGGIPGQ